MFTKSELMRLGAFQPITDKLPWATGNPDSLYQKLTADITTQCPLMHVVIDWRDCNYMATYIDAFICPKDNATKDAATRDVTGVLLMLSRLAPIYTIVNIKRFGDGLSSGVAPHPLLDDDFSNYPSLVDILPILHETMARYGLTEVKIDALRGPVDDELVTDKVGSANGTPYTEFDMLYYTDYSI